MKTTLLFYLEDNLKEKLKREAERRGLGLSSFIRTTMIKFLDGVEVANDSRN